MKIVSTIVVIGIGLGILFYIAQYGLVVHAVPTLGEYIASTTEQRIFNTVATSTRAYPDDGESPGAWLASSTLVQELFGGNAATSTPLISKEKSALLPFHAPQGTIYSYLARTPATRERGLSGRTTLGEDEGMLFIFPKPGRYAFWMKDMDFSIDMVWITAGKKVAGISSNLSPKSYPKTFSPPSAVQFVLEVPAGSAEKMGLKAGSIVSF